LWLLAQSRTAAATSSAYLVVHDGSSRTPWDSPCLARKASATCPLNTWSPYPSKLAENDRAATGAVVVRVRAARLKARSMVCGGFAGVLGEIWEGRAALRRPTR